MMASQSGVNDIHNGVHTMFAAATIVTQDNTDSVLQQLEESLSTPESIIMVISLSLITLLTIIGNTMVIIAIFNYKPLKNVQNMFLVNLAIADISVAIFVMPFSIVDMLYTRWVFGTFLCELWLTSDVLLCTASILTLCTIALDRYWAIYDPINYAQRRTIKQVLFKIACVWIISSLISIPPLFGLNDWPEEFAGDTPCKYSEHIGYVIYSASGSFYLPLLIMSVVYYKIYRATSKRLRGRVKAPSSQPMGQGHGPQPAKIGVGGGGGGGDVSRLECKPTNCVSYDNPLPSTATTTTNTKTPTTTTTATKSTNMTITTDSFRERSSNDNDSIVSTPSVILTPGQQSQQKFTLSSPPNIPTQHHSQYDCNLKKNAQLSATNIANIDSEEIDHHSEYESNFHRASISSCNNSNNNNNNNNNHNNNNSNSNHHGRSFSSSPIVSETSDRKMGQNDGYRPRESVVQRFWEEKQKISLSKERRAARILGAVMGVFTICWLPFFIMYLIIPFYPNISWQVRAFITWLGYVNSALNPIIYTIFNVDFRRAFQRQLCCHES